LGREGGCGVNNPDAKSTTMNRFIKMSFIHFFAKHDKVMLLATFLITGHLFAQSNITGNVTSFENKHALHNTEVNVTNTSVGTSTDANGDFSIVLPSGTRELTFSHVGFITKTLTIENGSKLKIVLYPDQIKLSEIIVTATREEQSRFSSPRSLTIANHQEILEKNQLSVLDVFNDKMGVWIEKRTTTTSDPVIRGLSGGNLLALADGNSFSTFWGEGGFAGDDLYGKIDGKSVERIEILRGPASVMYGSNALGGVVNFLPKHSPIDYQDKGLRVGGKVKGAYGSSSDYLMGRAETWGASGKVKYFAGFTTHHSGDMRAGGNIGYINPSRGKDYSGDVNTEYKINNNNFIALSGQYINRPEVYRSYRPTQSNTNLRWNLNLSYTSTHKTKLYDVMKGNLYQQYKKDTRTWFTDTDRDTIKSEGYAWWRSWNADVHFIKQTGANNRILYGTRYQFDIAESPGDEQFTMQLPEGNQPASPLTKWHNIGFFVQDEWDAKEWITLSAGLRYDYFLLKAGNEVFYTKPGDSDTIKNQAITDPARYSKNALTGSASAVFHLNDKVNLAATWAHGFRMFPPNFGFSQTGQGVLIPNGLLEPATADMFEISPRFQTGLVDADISVYYTSFDNFQQPTYGSYNGSEYYDFNNNGTFEPDERVLVNTANGKAYLYGLEAEFSVNLGRFINNLNGFYLSGGVMYNYGRMQFPEQEEVPLRHTHPPRILTKLRYQNDRPARAIWLELIADFVGKFDEVEQTRLMSDPGYLENPQDPTSGLYRDYGLPPYNVLHFRSGYRLQQNITFTFAIENILDIRYRTAHSRMDASGRNILVGIELTIPHF